MVFNLSVNAFRSSMVLVSMVVVLVSMLEWVLSIDVVVKFEAVERFRNGFASLESDKDEAADCGGVWHTDMRDMSS